MISGIQIATSGGIYSPVVTVTTYPVCSLTVLVTLVSLVFVTVVVVSFLVYDSTWTITGFPWGSTEIVTTWVSPLVSWVSTS